MCWKKVTEHITDMSVSLIQMGGHDLERADPGVINSWDPNQMGCDEGSYLYEDQSFKGINEGWGRETGG